MGEDEGEGEGEGVGAGTCGGQKRMVHRARNWIVLTFLMAKKTPYSAERHSILR